MNATPFRHLLALLLLAASLSAASAFECGSIHVLGRTGYDAFGTLIDRTGSTDNSFLYCGERWDANLGFYYLRARYMNPGTGRFWTMDEWEGNRQDPRTIHKYTYASANPVNNSDPSGHMSYTETMTSSSIQNILSQGLNLVSKILTVKRRIETLLDVFQVIDLFYSLGGGGFDALKRAFVENFDPGSLSNIIDLSDICARPN